MSIPAAVVAHCFAKCRARQNYTRVPGISKPVFACDGCGSTREIEELGRDVPPAPMRAPAPVVRNPARTRRIIKKETKTMPKTKDAPPLRAAIWDIVGERLAEIPPSLTRKDVAEIVREQINAALGVTVSIKKPKIQLTGLAAAHLGETRCPRGDHKYACPSKRCIEAGYGQK